MSNQTFKKGDKVFHAAYGWGKVMDIYEELECPVEVHFNDWGYETFTEEGRTYPGYPMVLSFTEYTLEGFSLERIEKRPNRGDIVWVRDFIDENWEIKHFLDYYGNQSLPYIASKDMTIQKSDSYKFLTTINPYTNEK